MDSISCSGHTNWSEVLLISMHSSTKSTAYYMQVLMNFRLLLKRYIVLPSGRPLARVSSMQRLQGIRRATRSCPSDVCTTEQFAVIIWATRYRHDTTTTRLHLVPNAGNQSSNRSSIIPLMVAMTLAAVVRSISSLNLFLPHSAINLNLMQLLRPY